MFAINPKINRDFLAEFKYCPDKVALKHVFRFTRTIIINAKISSFFPLNLLISSQLLDSEIKSLVPVENSS